MSLCLTNAVAWRTGGVGQGLVPCRTIPRRGPAPALRLCCGAHQQAVSARLALAARYYTSDACVLPAQGRHQAARGEEQVERVPDGEADDVGRSDRLDAGAFGAENGDADAGVLQHEHVVGAV